jgi:hypothetical protein
MMSHMNKQFCFVCSISLGDEKSGECEDAENRRKEWRRLVVLCRCRNRHELLPVYPFFFTWGENKLIIQGKTNNPRMKRIY